MDRSGVALVPMILVALLGSTAAHASPPTGAAVRARRPAAAAVVEVRLGAYDPGAPGAHPTICVEARPIPRIGFEACGNGAGFLHADPVPEVAHFRTKVTLGRRPAMGGHLRWGVGLGVAELQVGADAPGLRFGAADPEGIETAGPEVSLDASWAGGRREQGAALQVSATAGLAWLKGAPSLDPPSSALQPYGLVTVGVGW